MVCTRPMHWMRPANVLSVVHAGQAANYLFASMQRCRDQKQKTKTLSANLRGLPNRVYAKT
jgi:hypothetical protein